MVGIDPNVISHKLNMDPTFKPIKQKRRKFAPERNKVINDEVDNLLKTGKIREVKYPKWLANDRWVYTPLNLTASVRVESSNTYGKYGIEQKS
ncbi:hypothetical protein OSB04_024439 [Centaurea solstitialis]|uniref:Uncharacterized protein n=1 Tax=Centaurea solstitialis TaxID=347529 RepID=A0AA38W0M7_9ASTR|nr:hypothetical protein OSB04_024439 [Centaurea solstitialis]